MYNTSLKPGKLDSDKFFSDSPSHQISGIVTWRITLNPRAWRPATDVYETDNQIVVRVEIAGMQKEDFSITINNNILIISGSRSDKKERRAFHQMEIPFGEFSTEVEFSIPIEIGKVNAEYQNGFLCVYLPKEIPKHIDIKKM